ncbi:MAG: biotin--[acetyl-CoA-carboxylase] ligase [Candidatus Gastranaerophilales bacterium]|nr:biotin--[acetyl-CoA-carboxylase] ligase [Candidatus Gastranaerophilales bacterium]
MSKYSIITLEEVQSTNSYALEHIDCFEDGTVVYTPRQISGRGRYNRKWISDNTENLYVSIVLKPENTQSYPFANLTQYLSVILCKYLEQEQNLKPVIKWPNDILIDGAKISGILAESDMKKNKINAVVLGFGLNVNLKQSTLENIDKKAVSLSVIKNKTFDTENILKKICDMFFESYNSFIEEGFGYIYDDYVKRCGFLGQNIKISEAGGKKSYFAKSIDNEGFLLVNDELNNECKILTGDILC